MPTRRFVAWLAAVSLLGLAARVGYVLWVAPDTLGFDAVWYQLQGGMISGGHGYVDPVIFFADGRAVPTAAFPPLWPALLAMVDLLGAESQRDLQLVGAVVGSATISLAGVLGAIVADRRVGIVTAALVAGSPLLIAADGSLMAEPPYVALMTAAVIVAYRAIAAPTVARFAALGLVLGLSALARSDALIVAPVLIGATAWAVRARPARWRVGVGVLALGVAVITLVPWAARNSVRMGEPVLLASNSGSLLEAANCPGAYDGRLVGGWDASCMVETRRPGTDETTRAARARSAGIEYAADHPGRLPVVAAARVMRLWGVWNPVHQVDDLEAESRSRRWQLAGWAYASATLAAAAPGVVRLRRQRSQIAPLVGIVAGVTLVAVVSWGNQRFRLPAEPAVAVAAAVAFIAAAERFLPARRAKSSSAAAWASARTESTSNVSSRPPATSRRPSTHTSRTS
jgi:hypothetical protein